MAAHGSGAVFASLFFDQINSPDDQEGFLLGKIIDQVHDRISDSQISNYKVETRVCIYSYLPWPKVEKLYNQAGQFSIDLLKQFLLGKEKDVIGWYKFRRNSTLRPSLKETTLHHNLIYSLSLERDQPENFLFFLCSTFTSPNLATHTYDHCFLKHQHGKFHRIPVQILNLGDTTHTSYRQQANLGINPESGTIHSVLHKFRKDFVTSTGEMGEVKKICAMSETVNKTLQNLAKTVLENEMTLGCLEDEVQTLTNILAQKEEEHLPAKPVQSSSPPPPYMDIFETSPAPSRIKIHAMRSDMKFRRSIGDSDSNVRHVRQISVDEDQYRKEEDVPETASAVDIKEYEIIEGPEKMSQSLLGTCNSEQALSCQLDILTPEKARKDSVTGEPRHTRGTTPTKPGASEDDYEEQVSENSDHFSFLNTMLEKEKHSVKNDDCMAVQIGEKIKMPTSSDGAGAIQKTRTRSGTKQSGKHKVHSSKCMHDDDFTSRDSVNVTKARSQRQDSSRKVERSKSEMTGNTRTRSRQGYGQNERPRSKENCKSDYISDERCQHSPSFSPSPKNMQNVGSKMIITTSDSHCEQEHSQESEKHDSLDISSSPVF